MKRLQAVIAQKKGMTLVEMIVALAVFSVLTLGVATLLTPSIKIYMESTNLSRSNLILSNVLDRIADEIMYATDLSEPESWPAGTDAPAKGLKNFTYESVLYGTSTFENDDLDGVQIKANDSNDLLFSEDYYIGNVVYVGVELEQTKDQINLGSNEYGFASIQATLFTRNADGTPGKKVGSQTRYIMLLNTIVKQEVTDNTG